MADPISPETFDHLASLAALKLDKNESEYLRKQLINQLKAVDELIGIPIDDSVMPARHGVPYQVEVRPGLREDVWMPFSDTAAVLDQAPETSDNYFVVPDIPHKKLE